ncbi:MAG: hypothetical protein COV45_00150 [Deltaproteobacteria bacterium CG11_big_fil_rev_8_21_14_0_20_47_16]|nr:MAG: hypothetical protein COV45_00150 [Deltaproteobacteria bacterium CG11_big_fil_rev_8_21_14_0_20_47_16]
MSVILKALRSQQEGADSAPQDAGTSDSGNAFQVDTSTPTPGTGGPGSNKRTLILVIILIAAIILAVVLRLFRHTDTAPIPKKPTVAAMPAPAATPPAAQPNTQAAAENDLRIARSQYSAGEYDESLKSFQKAVELDPNNASIHNDMGLALLKKELYTSAETHFAKALELDDSCAECYNNLGYLKTILDQPMEAEKYLQKAVALNPSYPDPYFNLAVLYEKQGNIGKAVENYRAFLKLVPTSDADMIGKIKSRIHDLSGE